MIKGIGVDLVTVSRIHKVHERHGERFARRILAESEFDAYRQTSHPERLLAKRFAAKEAAVKALGTGEREGVLLKDFAVSHDELGKPYLLINGVGQQRAAASGISTFHLSISDEEDKVIAFVVCE